MTETTTGWPAIDSPETLATKLAERDYLPGDGLVQAAYLALTMGRPLFLEGDPGVGKTDFARRIADAFSARFIRLQCHAGLDVTQALYDWNFPRQMLALRAAGDEHSDRSRLLPGLYTEEFLHRRPILQALGDRPAVLLIDEIDRADDEFEALLLEVLEDYRVDIPEFGQVKADVRPLVVLTSNRTREVHDALKRRCLYHWITHPDPELEARILRRRVPKLAEALSHEIAAGMARVRASPAVTKPPGIAESIDFGHALAARGAGTLDPTAVEATLSTLVKHHDDRDVINRLLLVPGPRKAS